MSDKISSLKRKRATTLTLDESTDSEDENVLIRVGDIPFKKWYQGYSHIGYNVDGGKVQKEK